MTRHTPPGQVWTKIRQMKGGRPCRKIPALTDAHGNLTTDAQQIVNVIGSHLHEKTKNTTINVPNMCHLESSPNPSLLNINDHDITSLNIPFSMMELNSALSSCRNSAAGPDGLHFSPTKSKIKKFSRRRVTTTSPKIHINDTVLSVVSHHKILGLTFDSRLNWKRHIQDVKGNCMTRLNILKTTAHHHWGSEEEVLLRMYRALIRSKLDYGSPIYSSATEYSLKYLNTVHNSALRICLGAFRTSPSEILYCEANEPPLWLRRQQLLLSYSARVSANPQNPVYSLITSAQRDPPTSGNINPLPQIVKSLLPIVDLSLTTMSQISSTPPWTKALPTFNTSLTQYSKLETPRQLLKQAFSHIINRDHFDKIIYTDPSKSENRVSCSVTSTLETIKTCILPPQFCIHTAELFGILSALNCLSQEDKRVAVCTDSLASIQSIQNIFSDHPLYPIVGVCYLPSTKYGLFFEKNRSKVGSWFLIEHVVYSQTMSFQLNPTAPQISYRQYCFEVMVETLTGINVQQAQESIFGTK
ncbi:hypothetical protein NQ315_014473 [Exocentrus adspersus]|uniref:RNase H type-1 domain-containing protein n=1 Tax=Exocentrus adspersus TaxID=1586481 RepID=A0AAV8VEI7_9CUCU|nr:hypothetical protein NQ315_014473 [Exocentrus adspersus]